MVEIICNRKIRERSKSARDWNRTSTSLRTADFESAASTNSATRAEFEVEGLKFDVNICKLRIISNIERQAKEPFGAAILSLSR